MANFNGSSNIRSLMYSGKHMLLPPKCPFPSVSPSYIDYDPSCKAAQKPKEVNPQHQRTSSETHLIDEQPSWLDDLLNEPETPVRRGHRRSSSDSFAYVDVANSSNLDFSAQDQHRYKNAMPVSSWGSQDFDYLRDSRHASPYSDLSFAKQKNRAWEPSMAHSNGLPLMRENNSLLNSGSFSLPHKVDVVTSAANEKQDSSESILPDQVSEKMDNNVKPSTSETDTKRAKQQFAQRSRVRKLQYIAELERNVQALQAEGSEVAAEVEFLNQQSLILSMENKALKQRLESSSQEQLIKYLEQEVLEREIGRLRGLYQQQKQPQQQQSSSHRRSNSRDLDSQFANLSLKHKDVNSSRDPVTGPLRT